MPNLTPNYDFYLPLVNDPTDEDLWGGYLNDNFTSLDTLINTATNQIKRVVTGTDSATITDRNVIILGDATSGSYVQTLPLAATVGDGFAISFVKTDAGANTITVTAAGANTIGLSATTYVLSSQNSPLTLISDGVSNWNFQSKAPSAATTSVSGVVELATAAEVLTGTDAQRAITPDAFAGNKSLAANGYYKLPGGLIFQWGTVSVTANNTTVTFPTAFATSCYGVVVGHGTDSGQNLAASSITTTNFNLSRGGSQNETAYWQATGV